MKKKLVAVLLMVALVCGSLAAFAACGDKADLGHGDTQILIWVSEAEGIKDLTQKQISAWLDTKEGYREKYTFVVEGQTESESATAMVTDVATGADVYCFAQDQLAILVEANALVELTGDELSFITSNNDEGSARAATVNNKTFAYPITSDNGYFMYYDKSVVKAESIGDLAKIVADCEAAGKKFSFELGGSAWYTASFFFATGCTSAWSYDDETMLWKAADDFNSENGLIAMKGLQILTKSECWQDSSKAADFGAAIPSAVVISGTWDSGTAKENLGDNYAVAKLPQFTVDGQSYQLGSFSGFKLMGIKPQSNADKLAVSKEVARLLSGKEAQEARFDLSGWGPSNKAVQAMSKVKEDQALAALAEQNRYGTPQGNINGGWWDFAKLLGTASKDATSEADLQAALDSYSASIAKYESMPVDAVNAWGVVGSVASLAGATENLAWGQTEWKDWNTDLAMTKEEKDGNEVWTSAAITLTTTDEIKVRKGQGWNPNYGGSDAGAELTVGTPITATNDGPNLKVTADGTYKVVLTIKADGTATVEIIAA